MLVAGVDIETTGLEPGDHRIIEVYVGIWACRTQTFELLQRYYPQRSIMPAAQAVHGISLVDLEREPIWNATEAIRVREAIEQADVIVAHNGVGFDVPFINYELERVSVRKLTKPCFDTMLEGRWATPVGAVPNLEKLCWACEVDYDPALAHAASRVELERFGNKEDAEYFAQAMGLLTHKAARSRANA